jgi:dephospho-CoA kinase
MSQNPRRTALARRPAQPFVVAVTGGIGSGKTTVAKLFETLGAGIVDTDEVAHDLTRPGAPAITRIRERFGDEFLTAEGALDRARMRALVFRDSVARRDLETILHPLIRAEAEQRVRASRASYVLLIVPLLVESEGYRERAQRILVVDCDEAVQIERTTARSGLTEEQVRAIMASQATREQRLQAADDVVSNNAGLAELAEQVKQLHTRYLALARAARGAGLGRDAG